MNGTAHTQYGHNHVWERRLALSVPNCFLDGVCQFEMVVGVMAGEVRVIEHDRRALDAASSELNRGTT